MLDLSVVIPVYNEEENLAPLWAELRPVLEGLGLDFEVVFVDDGSQDRSAEIVRRLREGDTRVRLVSLKANAGETAATDAGFKAARGRMVVTMDADLQNDPADIPRLLARLDQWDAVCGWRDESIEDSGCTFRAFRRECVRGLTLYRGFHRFIPTLLRLRGYRVVELPVGHRPRRFGRSKYGVMNRAFVTIVDVLVVRWMKSRRLGYEVTEDLGGEPRSE